MICQKKITLKDGIIAPCGRCDICRSLNKKDWQFRIEQELKTSVSAIFPTLTYSNEFLPISEEGRMTLKKKDAQDFIKRIRQQQYRENIKSLKKIHPLKSLKELKLLEKKEAKLRYFLIGEYGTNTFRPHYHAFLFNVNENVKKNITKIWGKGSTDIGTVTPESINYVCDYVTNIKVPKYRPKNKDHEFQLASRKPIIGYGYLKNKDYHVQNGLLSVRNEEGNYQRLPQCYKIKFFTPIQLEYISIEMEFLAIEKDKIEFEKLKKQGIKNPQSYKNQQVITQIEKMEKNNKKRKKPI